MDPFEEYNRRMEAMASRLSGHDHEDFDTLRRRLKEILEEVELYGDTEQQRAARARILHGLNTLALKRLGVPFDVLEDDRAVAAASPGRCLDLAVYVALGEESETVLGQFGPNLEPCELPNIAMTAFCRRVTAHADGKEYVVGVVPSGKMGNTRAASVMSAILSTFAVRNVVVLGLAGSISDDLFPGDVFIPDTISEYLANSAAVGRSTLSFELSGNRFSTDQTLLNRFQNCFSTCSSEFAQWTVAAGRRWMSTMDASECPALIAMGVSRERKPRLVCCDDRILGSGPAVGKGRAFAKWLTTNNRKVSAVEMESAGVYDASLIHRPAPRTIAIRGISDFADERKRRLERSVGRSLRRAAIENATSLLLFTVAMGFFSNDPPTS